VISASSGGLLIHFDVTIIKPLDGTRTYLQAIIDNYSRRILSWTLETRLGSGATRRMLNVLGRSSARSINLSASSISALVPLR